MESIEVSINRIKVDVEEIRDTARRLMESAHSKFYTYARPYESKWKIILFGMGFWNPNRFWSFSSLYYFLEEILPKKLEWFRDVDILREAGVNLSGSNKYEDDTDNNQRKSRSSFHKSYYETSEFIAYFTQEELLLGFVLYNRYANDKKSFLKDACSLLYANNPKEERKPLSILYYLALGITNNTMTDYDGLPIDWLKELLLTTRESEINLGRQQIDFIRDGNLNKILDKKNKI